MNRLSSFWFLRPEDRRAAEDLALEAGLSVLDVLDRVRPFAPIPCESSPPAVDSGHPGVQT